MKLAHPLDRWILSYTEELVAEVTLAMDAYELQKAVPPLLVFIDRLTNWYIRLSRRRFWKSENDTDKNDAYTTLYYVLSRLSRLLAPFMPFISERMFGVLRAHGDQASVHLEDFPVSAEKLRDRKLETEMALVERVVVLGRNLRVAHKLRTRQPLSELIIVSGQPGVIDELKAHLDLIQDELNVKSVKFSADEAAFVTLSLKPNFKVLGKKVGSAMKEVSAKLGTLRAKEIVSAEQNGKLTIEVSTGTIDLSDEDFQVVRSLKAGQIAGSEHGVTVLLNAELSPELLAEGYVRDVMNVIQRKRKDLDLAYTDKIHIQYDASSALDSAVQTHLDWISRETLCGKIEKINGLDLLPKPSGEVEKETIEDQSFSFAITKI
jgi:isoleucyl-tRNA synthetase